MFQSNRRDIGSKSTNAEKRSDKKIRPFERIGYPQGESNPCSPAENRLS
jgi:hypothetical protein